MEAILALGAIVLVIGLGVYSIRKVQGKEKRKKVE